jgi:hypothetical protein
MGNNNKQVIGMVTQQGNAVRQNALTELIIIELNDSDYPILSRLIYTI